jgi:16S rRNA (guanine527-N7)-methyltransferase
VSSAQQLAEGVAQMGLALPTAAASKLLDFIALLQKWNAVYNLTAIRDEHDMVVQHLLDSLAILRYLPESVSLIDVGSGAGLPGIPLAIARPPLPVTLVEAVQKKSAFQQQAKIQLGLTNVRIYGGRVEQLAPSDGRVAVVSRAFADLIGFVCAAGHLVAPGGRLYAMKGTNPTTEIAELPRGWRLAATEVLHVPGLAAQRHLIVLEKL